MSSEQLSAKWAQELREQQSHMLNLLRERTAELDAARAEVGRQAKRVRELEVERDLIREDALRRVDAVQVDLLRLARERDEARAAVETLRAEVRMWKDRADAAREDGQP